MKVIFYSADEQGIGSRVQEMIAAQIPKEGMEIYRSVQKLAKRFRYRSHDVVAAVLVAAGTQDLKSLISIRDLLEDTRIILILPNDDQRNLSLSYSLYPRFIGYADGKEGDIAAVINHLFGTAHKHLNG